MKQKGFFVSVKKYVEEGTDEIRLSISNGIYNLLKTIPLEKIQVGEICKKASVGRTTFYRYFGDKNGIKEALLFGLTYNWGCLTKDKKLLYYEKDELLLKYLYDNKNLLYLLKSNNCLDIVDSFVIYIHGPKKDDETDFYAMYAAAGLWIGLIRAIIATDFQDSPENVQNKMSESLMKMILANQN